MKNDIIWAFALLFTHAGWPDRGCWRGDVEYPDTWCDFGCAKAELDPTGKFTSSATDRRVGPWREVWYGGRAGWNMERPH